MKWTKATDASPLKSMYVIIYDELVQEWDVAWYDKKLDTYACLGSFRLKKYLYWTIPTIPENALK